MTHNPNELFEYWKATCGACGATYEHLDRPSEAALHAGTFCPNCKAMKRFALGVLNWKVSFTVPSPYQE